MSRREASNKYMNLNLSTSDWLNVALGVLFLYRGIRDLYNGTGTGWSSEDEKNHFHRPFGILSLLCGALTQQVVEQVVPIQSRVP